MLTNQYVLGIDHGTGGCKVTCLASNGKVISDAYVSYPSYYPHPLWVEQDPEQWIEAAILGVQKTLKGFSDQERQHVSAIGFSAPHHVAVLLDQNNRVLRNAIMWNDQRSGEQVKELTETSGKMIMSITNNSPTPTWTLSHLKWISDNEPEVFEQIHKIVFLKDYVRYRFCGELSTDYIEAEGTLLFDMNQHEWSESVCSMISLDRKVLPNVYLPTDQAGNLTTKMAEKIGVRSGIPLIIGTADTAAEVYGSGATDIGDGVVKLATAGNVTVVTDQLSKNPKLTSYEHVIKGNYYHNSGTNFAASSLRWFKEGFCQDLQQNIIDEKIYGVLDQEIENIGPGAEGLIFQPYLNGERCPHWDPNLRGSFFGCTARHNRSHFARAILEGVGYSLRDASHELNIPQMDAMRIIGGGSKGKVWVQIIADILNSEMEIPKESDASFGVCLLTATAIGWFSDLKEAVNQCQVVIDRVIPDLNNREMYDEMFHIYKELHSQTKNLTHRLTKLH